MRSLLRWQNVVSVAAVLICFLLVSGQSSAQTRKITMAEASRLLVFSPLYVALELGYFAEEGIEIELVHGGGTAALNAALINGDIDVAAMSGPLNFQALAQTAQPFAISAFTGSVGLQLTASRAFVERIGVSRDAPLQERMEALRGASIGAISVGGASEMLARYMLLGSGVDPNQVQFVRAGVGAAAVAALERGAVDALFFSPPAGSEAEDRGVGIIWIDPREVPVFQDLTFEVLATLKPFAEANEDLMVGLARALARGNHFVRNNPDEASELIHEKYFPGFELANLKRNIGFVSDLMPVDGRMTETGWRNAIRAALDLNFSQVELNPVEGEIWTNKYIDRANLR